MKKLFFPFAIWLLILVSCVDVKVKKNNIGTFVGFADTSQLSTAQKKFAHYFANGKDFQCYGRFAMAGGDTITVLLDPDLQKNPGDTAMISKMDTIPVAVE